MTLTCLSHALNPLQMSEGEQSPTFEINQNSGKTSQLPLAALGAGQRMRQRYRMRNTDHESMRYECICSNQYFCYTSLYQHMKKHHKDFIQKNRFFAANNSVQTVDPKYGFKIRKILLEKVEFRSMMDVKKEQLRGEQLRQIRLNQKQVDQKLKKEFMQKVVIARQRLSEINFDNEQIDRKVKLTRQMIEKSKQISHQMHAVIATYQKILSIMNIQEIVKHFDDQSDDQEDNYQP